MNTIIREYFITENNKLIADFMGDRAPIGHIAFKEYEYHTSWDWLMPVVEKIMDMDNQEKRVFVVISGGEVKIQVEDEFLHHVNFDGITNVYKALVEFIKWYNENKED